MNSRYVNNICISLQAYHYSMYKLNDVSNLVLTHKRNIPQIED